MQDMSDLRKSIAERLGSAAKSARPGAKAKMAKYRAFVYRGSPRSNVLVKATEWMDSAIAAEEAAKQIAMSFRGQPGYNSDNYFADIAQETPMGAKTVKNNVRFSRPGAKAKMAMSEVLSFVNRALQNAPVGLLRDVMEESLLRYWNHTQAAKKMEQRGDLANATKHRAEAGRETRIYTELWYKMGKSALDLKAITDALNKMTASRPGAKAKFGNADALLSLADGYVSDGNDEAGLLLTDLVKMRNRGLLSADQSKTLDKIIRDARAMGVFSRPGAKAKFADDDTRFRKLRLISAYLANEANDITDKQIAEWKSIVQEAMTSSDANIVRLAKRIKDTIGFSRPGAKAVMAQAESKYLVVLESKATQKNVKFRTMATSESDARLQATAAYGDKWEVIAVVQEHSRPGAKAKMAKWESTLTKKYGKPIEEYTARLKGGMFKIEVGEGSDGPYAILYRWDDLRGMERIASGNLQSLMRQAESMGAKEARGVAAIERLANYSRPGAKGSSKAKA